MQEINKLDRKNNGMVFTLAKRLYSSKPIIRYQAGKYSYTKPVIV